METGLCTNPLFQQRPALSAGLRQRIERDFQPRWARDWGGRSMLAVQPPRADAVRLDGNDYLAVTGHPDIVKAQVASLLHDNQSVVQSGVFQREDQPARALERELARWTGHEDALLCQSGYAANLAALQCFAGADTPVYIDGMAHPSLWEGIRAARALAHPFRHNDPEHLDRLMGQHGPGLVVVDSVYSTSGTVCPLQAVVEVVERHGSMLLVDESHSLGTHGPAGAGLCVALGLTHRVHFISASLAKAVAGRAGFFTFPAHLREYVITTSFPTIFSSCLLSHEVAGLMATVEHLKGADEARHRLRRVTHRIRTHLTALGYVLPGSEQIISLEIGSEAAARDLRDAMCVRGVLGSIFFAPATSRNRAMVRLTLNAGLAECELTLLERVMAELVPQFRPDTWAVARRLRKVRAG
ncbi:alpha-hydroxyketone-type quorum-sensing autoinducer synthase [Hydrogenophaga sp. R2]|uniref:alpha-hydroxyketone-type quorum-sensing autoinducer synthase n=1 Tax=Hydrogenophaga sp. R2 TaxID=3132827 RepID=UPI003CF1C25A